MKVRNSIFATNLYFKSLSFIQSQLDEVTIIVAKSTCQETNFYIKNLICDIIVTQMEFYKLISMRETMHIVLTYSIITHFMQNYQSGSLLPCL